MVKSLSDVPQGAVPRVEPGSALSSSLLLRLKAHDADAWRRLVHLYRPVVYGWCRRAGLHPHHAADVGHGAFLAVAQGPPPFRGEHPAATFPGWPWGSTLHKAPAPASLPAHP